MDGERTLTHGMIDAKMRPGGRVVWDRITSTNDSDYTYTVPAGKLVDMFYIYVQIQTTATVGDRSLAIQIGNGSANLIPGYKTGAIAASKFGSITWEICPYMTADTIAKERLDTMGTAQDVSLGIHYLTRLLLPAGYTIRMYDRSAIDAAADDMIIVLGYIEYDA